MGQQRRQPGGSEFPGFGGVLRLRFETGATSTLVDAVMRAVTFQNNSASAADFTIEYVFSDGAGGSVTDTILISATDGSSNASLITSGGGKASAIFAVLENKTAVTTITGSNPVDVSGPIAFSISGGLDAAKFVINASTGALTFLAAPDYETPADADADNVYDVVVRAETTGIAAGLFDSQAISVVIADLDGVTITGTAKANTLTGGIEGDMLFGLAGNDILIGRGSGDRLDGGAGSDTASYANAATGIFIDLFAGAGLGGDASGDTFISIENLMGGAFGDGLFGNDLANRITGGGGGDFIEGRGGNDVLNGGTGIDTVTYQHAGSGVRVSLANTKAQITLGAGKDTISGFENLTGSEFADKLTGDKNANVLNGLGGADVMNGGAGSDTLFGGAGSDILNGGAGIDMLTGGAGEADIFVFNAALSATTNIDTITDFEVGLDKIRLENAIFTKLGAAGALSAGAFALAADVPGLNDRIIYNATSGALIYNSNGSAAGGQIHFATLSTGLALSALDFMII